MFTETKPKNDSPLRFMKNKENDMVVLKIGDAKKNTKYYKTFTGVVVRTDEACHPVGYYHDSYNANAFEPINGTLEL